MGSEALRQRMVAARRHGGRIDDRRWSELVREAEVVVAERWKPLKELPHSSRALRSVGKLGIGATELLGIEAKLAELEWRLAELEECGAVEWAIRQKALEAAEAVERALKDRGSS